MNNVDTEPLVHEYSIYFSMCILTTSEPRLRLLQALKIVLLAFRLCCFYSSAVVIEGVIFPFSVLGQDVDGIRLYRFLIITFYLLCKNADTEM